VKKLLFLLIGIGLALTGGAWWWKGRHDTGVEPEAYTFAAVEHGPLAEVVSATGVLQPRDVYVVGSEMSGKVVAVLADFNQMVEEGDPLLRLDDRPARDRLRQAEVAVEGAHAGVKQAQAAHDTARRALERERKRAPEVRQQAILDAIEGQLRTAEAVVETAQVKVREAEEGRRQAEWGLSQTTICAPLLGPPPEGSPLSAQHLDRPGVGVLAGDETTLTKRESARNDKQHHEPEAPATGPQPRRSFVVLERKVSLNQVIGPPASAHLFTLAGDLQRMQVTALVAEADVLKVARGMKAQCALNGAPEGEPAFAGKVEEVRLTPASDRGAVFYKVVLDVRNERDPATGEWKLRPGQTVSVEFIRRKHKAAWKLPAAALAFQPDESVQSEAARARLRHWQARPDRDRWRTVWVEGPDHLPWPVFARIGGADAIQDGQFCEVLEWDPEMTPVPDPRDPATYPKPIIGMTAPHKGWFEPSRIKL
jgi:HlyD family secretion protein